MVMRRAAAVAILIVACGGEGEMGPPGPQGEMGAPGAPGDDGKISASIRCFGGLEGTDLAINYDAVQFSSGYVFASAMVTGPAFQSSGAVFYAPTQAGWATAPVTIVFDVFGTANAGWWDISLNRQTLVVTAKYTDSEVSGGMNSWATTPDKCVLNQF